MQNEYRICDKCKAVDSKKLIKIIKEIDKNCVIKIGCQNFCGIGRTKPFIILNNIPIIGNNEDDLINKIKEKKVYNK